MEKFEMMLFEVSGISDIEENGDIKKMVHSLNQKSDDICQYVENEIKKLFPAHIKIRSSLQFDLGSLLLSGTIALLSWGGSIILESAKDEVKNQIGSIIKISIQRAINRFVTVNMPNFSTQAFSKMEMTVSPMGSYKQIDDQSQFGIQEKGRNNLSHRMLVIWLSIISVLQVLLILQEFFVIELK